MQTINPNLASFLSHAELRKLLNEYENPATPLQGLLLLGIQTRLAEFDQDRMEAERMSEVEEANDSAESAEREVEILKEQIDAQKEQLEKLEEDLREARKIA